MANYADIILKNGTVFDGFNLEPFKGGVAMAGDKILACGSDEEMDAYKGADTQVIDCAGKLIMPGFNDAHTHAPYGSFLLDADFGLNFEGAVDKKDFLPRLKEFADAHPDNEWIFGYNGGWSAADIPDRYELDEFFPDRPVVVQHMDGHSMVVNGKSFEKRGVTNDSKPPEGGRLGRDDDGILNGRLYDDATFMFSQAIYNPADEEFKRIYRNFFDTIKAFGITALGELWPTFVGRDDIYGIFKEMEDDGELTARISFPVRMITFDAEDYRKNCEKYNSDKLYCKGVKELADGVITVHTALLLEPYDDEPGYCGCLANDEEDLHQSVLRACKAGVPVRLHCIGDGAVRKGLDWIEEGEKLYGYHGERHGLEHIEGIDPADLPRFKELNVCANMQPMHAVFDPGAEEMFRGERVRWAWAMRSLLDNGAIMSMGTDFPIVGLNPFHSLYAAVLRKDPFGNIKETWIPEECITIGEALKAHTWGSAYCTSREDKIGTLEAGKYADVIVVNQNLFEIDPEEIKDATVGLTIFDGKVIYDAMN